MIINLLKKFNSLQNIKGVVLISLPITKKQFNDGVIKFIDYYNRLPYLPEDDVMVDIKNDKGEVEARPYRANKYIKEYYKSKDKMTKYFLGNNLITYKDIADNIKLSEKRTEELINKTAKDVNKHERRAIHIFFNKDFYPELGLNNKLCESCRWRKCKQAYFTEVHCPKYKKSTKKK